MTKRSEAVGLPAPTEKISEASEGPDAESLLDTEEIYTRVVYKEVHADMNEWDEVKESEALPYLPTRKEEVNINVGIKEKTKIKVPLLGFIKLEDHFQYKKGYILNTGGNTWGLDFVPKVAGEESDRYVQYLAVSGYRGASEEHMGLDEIQPEGEYQNCIQLWKLRLSARQKQEDPVLALCILHDFGVVYDLKWCPYGTYEERSEEGLAKLGILAIACGDGTIRTLVVPHPAAIRSTEKTIYLRVKKARATLFSHFSRPLSIDWGGHQKLASTGTAGDLTLWNMQSALTRPSDVYGQHLISASMVLDSPGKSVAWRGRVDGRLVTLAGLDGQARVVDVLDPQVPFTMSRSRGPIHTTAWAGHSHMMLQSSADDTVRFLSYSASLAQCFCRFCSVPGTVWDLAVSEHHGHVSIVNATGWNILLNVYQKKKRSKPLLIYVAYKLCFHEPTNTFTYVDGIGVLLPDELENMPRYELFSTPEVAIQKSAWNPNRSTSGFVATAGSAGLCRIEFEGRGSGWQ